jgi:hypothetical protein
MNWITALFPSTRILTESRHGSLSHRFKHYMKKSDGYVGHYSVGNLFVHGHRCKDCGYVTPNIFILNAHPSQPVDAPGWNYGTEQQTNMNVLFPARAQYVQQSP